MHTEERTIDQRNSTGARVKKQDGNPEGVALDSRVLVTLDAGCASSWGWGETGDQGDLSLSLNLCNSGNFLFSR